MKKMHFTFVLPLLLAASFTHAAECGKPITASAAAAMAANTTLGDVAARFGTACAGDGPVSWYQAGAGKQIWFYWKKTASLGAANTPVLMVAEVDAADPDQQKIIWPQALVGKEAAAIMLNEFGPAH